MRKRNSFLIQKMLLLFFPVLYRLSYGPIDSFNLMFLLNWWRLFYDNFFFNEN